MPLVVRLEGTNVQQGKDILACSGLPIIAANDLGDAAKKIVAEVKRRCRVSEQVRAGSAGSEPDRWNGSCFRRDTRRYR